MFVWHGLCSAGRNAPRGAADLLAARLDFVVVSAGGACMERLKVAAQFVAFVWYLNSQADSCATPAQAGRFAREKWPKFLPLADEELAKVLTEKPARPTRSKMRERSFTRPKSVTRMVASGC